MSNSSDKLFKFNDEAFHLHCINKDAFGLEAIFFAKKFWFLNLPENRKCSISNELIFNQENFIFFDVLTSDSNEKLFDFNLTIIDKNNLGIWIQRNSFIKLATNFVSDGKWKDISDFEYLNYLIKQVPF